MTLYYGSIGHGIYGGGLGSSSTADVDGKSGLTTTSADVTGNTNVFILGGEALILPLMGLLLYVGYEAGRLATLAQAEQRRRRRRAGPPYRVEQKTE